MLFLCKCFPKRGKFTYLKKKMGFCQKSNFAANILKMAKIRILVPVKSKIFSANHFLKPFSATISLFNCLNLVLHLILQILMYRLYWFALNWRTYAHFNFAHASDMKHAMCDCRPDFRKNPLKMPNICLNDIENS